MKLYYTRHGETEWNVLDNICGRTDIPLTAKGIEQAEELARNIADMGLHFDLILVSPLQRAQQTAARVAAVTGMEPVTEKRLRECDYGDFEGKHRLTEGYMEAKLDFPHRFPNGESAFDLAARTYGLIDEVYTKYPHGTVLFVCHGGICRIIESFASNFTAKDYENFYMGNCELRCVEINRQIAH